MGKITDGGLTLEGPALEDARRVINWGLRFTAGALGGGCEVTSANLGVLLEELAGRARLAEQLGEPGEPTFEATGVALEPDALAILAEAAQELAGYAADSDEGSFREAQLEAAWRTLLLVEPPEWTAPPEWTT